MKALGAMAVCALSIVSCGPSFQAVYECDIRFEHCYAVDMTDEAVDAKRACWRDWVAGYTYGESRDRVEHARSRIAALSADPPDPSDAGPSKPSVNLPMPINAFAPPPIMSDARPDAGADASTRDASVRDAGGPPMPGSACAAACASRYDACRGTCKGLACAACDRAYRACMPPCFLESPDAGRPLSQAM
jgi:hypothetical protein